LRDKQAGEIVDIEDMKRCLQGNLCRCTGYRPILEGMATFCNNSFPEKQTDCIEDHEEVLATNAEEFKEYSSGKCDSKVPEEVLSHSAKFMMLTDPTSGEKWYRPTSLNELGQLQRTLGEFTYQSGGTGWYQMGSPSSSSSNTVNLSGIGELKGFHIGTEGSLHFGAGLTLTSMEKILKGLEKRTQLVDALIAAILTLASPQVRNVATIGGNVMWDHPGSDLRTIYLAVPGCKIGYLDGQVADFKDWFYRAKDPKALITELILPATCKDVYFFRKARRKEFDLPIANACFVASTDRKEVSIVFGGLESALENTTTRRHVFAKRCKKFYTRIYCTAISKSNILDWPHWFLRASLMMPLSWRLFWRTPHSRPTHPRPTPNSVCVCSLHLPRSSSAERARM
jgi:CO/xanthine dehydrogenase FAD-binding subunit